MITTARFELQRSRQLKKLFSKERLVNIWRHLVKEQMRRQDIKDLHDYYDFNYSIESRAEVIIDTIMSGLYRADIPLVFRAEKKLGICRHMMIPSPSDALVFQTLTDQLYSSLIKKQPSKNAYYARDRHALALPHEHEQASDYPWFILWPRFQRQIWHFSRSHKYLVLTDVLNYFDNIGLRELRHVISSLAGTKEVYLDLLFSLIENLSWTPDYLPKAHKGLPTINIEAPRLLAHALLFEIDYVLKKRTKNSFVRWMDDINFGVDEPQSANMILGEINDMLKSRGLALNLAKTLVVTQEEAEMHFMFKENLRLTKIAKRAKRLKTLSVRRKLAVKCTRELKQHIIRCEARNKDKVTKRYFTILGTLRISSGLDIAVKLFRTNPGLRDAILNYCERLPFNALLAKHLLRLFDKTDIYDDVTLFKLVECLVNLHIPRNRSGRSFISEIRGRLDQPQDAFTWLCLLYFIAKYGEPHDVLTSIAGAKKAGAKSIFFTRQSMAALSRGLGINHRRVKELWSNEVSTGASDAASVANNMLRFYDGKFPLTNNKLHRYLFPQTPQKPYPLAKFLILCVLASSEKQKGKDIRRPEVLVHVSDPWYLYWLKSIHPAWF